MRARVDVWRLIFIRNAVKKIIFTAYFLHLFAVNRGDFLFLPCSQYSYKKEPSLHEIEPLTSCMSSTFYSTAPIITFFYRIHRISYINLLQKSMRRIFVTNAKIFAMNLCQNCGEILFCTVFTAITSFLIKIYRIHRISLKNSPKNLDCFHWRQKVCIYAWRHLNNR